MRILCQYADNIFLSFIYTDIYTDVCTDIRVGVKRNADFA